MTPLFENTFNRLLNEILLPKFKRTKNENSARYANSQNINYTGTLSTKKITPGEIQHGQGGTRYKTTNALRLFNNPDKNVMKKSKRDPRQNKRMDGSGIYKDDERLGNSKLNLRAVSRFGPNTRMRPIINNPKKYHDKGVERKYMKSLIDNQPDPL